MNSDMGWWAEPDVICPNQLGQNLGVETFYVRLEQKKHMLSEVKPAVT